MPIRLSEDRPDTLQDYQRLRHTTDEVRTLRDRGFIPVISSNVSAVGREDGRLIIRFHGGATYAYPNDGDRLQDILSAPSKGRFVWQQLRRRGVPYQKIGNVVIEDDVEDRDLMRDDVEAQVDISTLVNKDRAATIVRVEQEGTRDTVIDLVRTRARPETARTDTVSADGALALLGGAVSQDMLLSLGIIAALAVARDINSRQA
jgi:hypothetical protein